MSLVMGGVAWADNVQNDVSSPDRIVEVTAGGAGATVNYNIHETGGDSTDKVGPKCNAADDTPATVTPTGMPTGVTTSPASVSFADCSTAKGIAFAAGAATVPGDYTINVTVTDSGAAEDDYNTNPARFTLRVSAPSDTTAPTTVASVTTGTAGSNGWYTSDVSVSLEATDNTGGSGVKQVTYSALGAQPLASTIVSGASTTVSITTEGTTTISFSAEDNAGNIEATKTFEVKLDKTAPTLNPAVNPNPILRNGTATASPNASDSISGVASSSCDAVDTSTVGANQTVTCYATDNAGLSSQANATYSVVLAVGAFGSPVDMNVRNVAKAGQAIPLKFYISDAVGPVTDLASVSVTMVNLSCSRAETDDIEGYAAGSSGLQNLGGGYYQFNWKTPTSYANSCKTMTLTAGGGTQSAAFEFKK